MVAGAPLGGLVERDPNDKYGLARKLIHPLLPWLREAKYNGPLASHRHQAVAGRWHVIEYNIRIGVTSGPMILRMLKNPAEIILRTARNEKLDLRFNEKLELRLFTHAGGLRLSVHPRCAARICRWKWMANLIAMCGGMRLRAARIESSCPPAIASRT